MNGFLEREYSDGGINYNRHWKISSNSITVKEFYFLYEADIITLTENEFFFRLDGAYTDNQIDEIRFEQYELKR